VLALRRIGRLAVHPDLFAINSQSILNTYLVLRKSAMLPCKSSPYPGIDDDLRLA
jgi:hypothetical protein